MSETLPPFAGTLGSRPLAPRGGNDRVWTPDYLAVQIVEHFQPSGNILEPCKGEGAFTRAMPSACWCEISEGIDFLTVEGEWDWIVTNPPWSQFRPFLRKSMEVSDNVVFLSLLNAWFMRARVRDMREAGFGIVEVLMLDTPPKPWPQTGFQLAAVHARRGHEGQTKFCFANVRDDLPGTAGMRDAAKPSISSDSGGGLGRSLR